MTLRTPTRCLPLLALCLVACAGADNADGARAPASGSATAGGVAAEAAPEVATGPVQSYVRDEHTVVMRLDMSRVRASAVADDIGSLVRSYPAWQRLLEGSGIDPVRDFERVLVAAETTVTDTATMLIVHNLGNARVREAVLQMAAERGEQPEWRQVDGFDVVDWPAETNTPRVVVLAGPQELIVTSPAELDAIIAVAHDHRLRRNASEVIEPALQLDDRVIATVAAQELGERMASRIEHPPESYELQLSDHAQEAGRMVLHARANYADPTAAEAARAWAVRQRDFFAGQMLVRAVGLDRVLRDAVIATDGADLLLDASFTEEEVQRVLGLLAFAQIGDS